MPNDLATDLITARLQARYPTIPAPVVEEAVATAVDRFAEARIQTYTSLLAERVALGEIEARLPALRGA